MMFGDYNTPPPTRRTRLLRAVAWGLLLGLALVGWLLLLGVRWP